MDHGKEGKSLTLPFPSEAFRLAWKSWVEFRIEKKKPLTEHAIKLQLSDCEKWGEEGSIESINASIKAGWQGLFAPKVTASRNKGTTNETSDYIPIPRDEAAELELINAIPG